MGGSKRARSKQSDLAPVQEAEDTETVCFVESDAPTEKPEPQQKAAVSSMDLKSLFTMAPPPRPNSKPTMPVEAAAPPPQPEPVIASTSRMPESCPPPRRRRRVALQRPADLPIPSTEVPQNSLCWWDGHAIDDAPISLPGAYDVRQRTFSGWRGAFCSWGCARAYAQFAHEHKRIALLWQLRAHGCSAEDLVVCDPIPLAPHFGQLEAYGGSMRIDQFRAL